jgi:hypothetical protein
MKPINPNSPCVLGCKYSTKCHADKSYVIECKRYEPKEEYIQMMMELKSTLNSYNARK